jgi:cardiolipin synthase
MQFSAVLVVIQVIVFVAVSVRVIMRRSARGVALSWLLLVAALPLAGALVYLLIGERRIGRKRSHGINSLRVDFRQIAKATILMDFTVIDWSDLPAAAQAMDRLGRSLVGGATVRGNTIQLFSDTQRVLAGIVRDVDAAKSSVLMEFYIWNEGGAADEVLEAVIRAAGRGVRCYLLIDSLGARPRRSTLRSTVRRFRAAPRRGGPPARTDLARCGRGSCRPQRADRCLLRSR